MYATQNPKTTNEIRTVLPSIPNERISRFVEGPMPAKAMHAASTAFRKALIERALYAELGTIWAIRLAP